ncbi:YheC/YheD family protein [Thalassobacillus devorans]|uniref:YheC/YheD family protein n=1 Tax=Thalassobacillus devorans TaxID=279813 RepID=UPI0020CAC1A4|nr:YheC/YheD family protein [Thalassobacillus devorans]
MRRAENPPFIAKITAVMCHYYGFELIYMRPKDIDMANNTVRGRMYINNKWVEVTKDLPALIDISAYCFMKETRELMEYLRKNVRLTFDKKNALNKAKLQRELAKDGEFSHLVIPTAKAKTFEDVEAFLEKYSTIVMKPVYGQQGKGIYKLKQNGDEYLLGYQKEEQRLTRDELEKHFQTNISGKNYILQKYITSRSKAGDPFDCRIHVQKNRNGKWQVAKKYIRIGIGQKVMSNVNQGGGISDTKPFLKANFDDKWKEIEDNLTELGETLPYKIEQLKKTPTMSIGFDVAIDKSGDLYLFESNGAPNTTPLVAHSALLNVEYYTFIRDNELNEVISGPDTQHANSDVEIDRLKQKNEQLEKRMRTMEQSTSWRVTAPLRILGKLLKKN